MKLKYTKMQRIYEIIGVLILLGMVVNLILNWNNIPEQIPGHYNFQGEVDRWGNKSEILAVPIISIILYLFLTLISFFPQIWNVPVKVTDANKEPVYRSSRSLLILTKIEMAGMFCYISYYIAASTPLPVYFLPITLLIVFGTMIYYIFRIIKLGKQYS